MPSMLHLLSPQPGDATPPLHACRWADFRHEYTDGTPPSVNRGLPLAVHLVWEREQGFTLGDRRYDVLLGRNPDLENARVWSGLAQTSLDVSGLHLGARYYWKVVERRRGEVTDATPVGWFDTHPEPPRWLSAHGIANLRDAGGWSGEAGRRVRQGLVYRSAEINNHTRLSQAARRYLHEEIGIRTDLDLRGPDEKPGPALHARRVAYVNAPVGAYHDMTLDWSRTGYRIAFETLSRPESYPILVHCWGGADRTGTLIFLLNGLLGVSVDDRRHDYEVTSLSGVGRRLATSIEFGKMLGTLQGYAPTGAPPAEQVTGFLLSIGVESDTIRALQRNLLEPAV